MAFAHFYHGKTRSHVASFTEDVLEVDLTPSLNGRLSGILTIQERQGTKSFLEAIRENSHFVKVGVDHVYGGVTQAAVVEQGIWTIEIIGCYEYLEKIDLVSSHKAGVTSGVSGGDDYSWIKLFYADSSLGILYEVLVNLSQSMVERGYNSSLFDYTNLRSNLVSTGVVEWGRSYRLNSLEVPTVQSVIEDILQDDGMELFRIRVTPTVMEDFRFIMEVVPSASVHSISEATSRIGEISRDTGAPVRRAFSIARGTDLRDNSRVERRTFDSNVAYSSMVTSVAQERSGAIGRQATTAASAELGRLGTFSFTSLEDDYDLLDYIILDASAGGWSSQGIITEKTISVTSKGPKFIHTVQEGPAPSFNGVLTLPSSLGRKIIFDKLDRASNVASVAANRQVNATGWRS